MAYILRLIVVGLVYAGLSHQAHFAPWGNVVITIAVGIMALESGAWNRTSPSRRAAEEQAKAQEDGNILRAIERGMRQRPRL